jgi:tetrahydrodipicolinate N-succinyltransferase
MVEVGDAVGVGVGVVEVGVGVEVAAGDDVVVGVAVGAGVAVEVGAKANGSITTRTIKAPKVKGLVKLLIDAPENERLVPIELSNKMVSLASPLASIIIKKLPESTKPKLEISKLFQPPVPTVEVVDIGGTISFEKLDPVICMVKLSPAAYHA